MKQFDVIVIGAGHAGVEAADAAARTGVQTALISFNWDGVGAMSCNPAIGGLGKGHLVREIDALDGVMGRAADAAGIQFRLLNRKKGPAVRGPRAQIDRNLYKQFMQAHVLSVENLHFIEAEVVGLTIRTGRVVGVETVDGEKLEAQSVILTSGTFLNGVIHIGHDRSSGGRMGDKPSIKLADQLYELNLPMGRLKTGTPPRLNGKTINWDVLDQQPGDDIPSFFSDVTTDYGVRQVPCWITHTNERTHDVIRKNLEKSAMYGGQVEGIGPRYCPSIEDKIVRFSDKDSHQVFLEPESLSNQTIYPNGISTSLPAEVQLEYVRSITGLENVEIQQLGYAIEYDFINPQSLTPWLELKELPGLFLAGQINGTTGYEEAAAQGLVAGVNAARRSRGASEAIFSRRTSYIGVLIDDLVTRGVTEPYRMFTSRAEYRLSLRSDNADQRLTAFGREVGLVGDVRWNRFSEKSELLEKGRTLLSKVKLSARQLSEAGVSINPDSAGRSAYSALSLNDVEFETLLALCPKVDEIDSSVREQLKNDALYQSYIDRQNREMKAFQKDEETLLPLDLDYFVIGGLSKELQVKLSKSKPTSLAMAGKIDGMTPAAQLVLRAYCKKLKEAG